MKEFIMDDMGNPEEPSNKPEPFIKVGMKVTAEFIKKDHCTGLSALWGKVVYYDGEWIKIQMDIDHGDAAHYADQYFNMNAFKSIRVG